MLTTGSGVGRRSQQALDLTLVALAGEQAGAAERCLVVHGGVRQDAHPVRAVRSAASRRSSTWRPISCWKRNPRYLGGPACRGPAGRRGSVTHAEAVSLAAFSLRGRLRQDGGKDSIQMHGGIAFNLGASITPVSAPGARRRASCFGTPVVSTANDTFRQLGA